MSDIHAELRARVDTFTEELAALVRRAALEAVREALNAPQASPITSAASLGSGRKRRAAAAPAPTPRAARAGRAAPAPKAAAVGHAGQKRDPKLLAKLVERLHAQITSKPGQRIEQINKPLGVPTKDLSLPIKKLLRANRIVAKGQKRSTTYWPK